jgi:hypothetical protein
MLQEFNAKNAQFRILPQYKVKSEGEVVSSKLLILFYNKYTFLLGEKMKELKVTLVEKKQERKQKERGKHD